MRNMNMSYFVIINFIFIHIILQLFLLKHHIIKNHLCIIYHLDLLFNILILIHYYLVNFLKETYLSHLLKNYVVYQRNLVLVYTY